MDAHVMALNEFNMPKVFKDLTGNYMHVIYLILLDKGKFQSHPDMGVGLRSRYRFTNAIEALKDDITEQMATYLPDIKNVSVDVSLTDDHILGIIVSSEEASYVLAYNTLDDTVTIGQDALDQINP